MRTIDPTLVTALVTVCVGALMAYTRIAKRQLAWGRDRQRKRRP